MTATQRLGKAIESTARCKKKTLPSPEKKKPQNSASTQGFEFDTLSEKFDGSMDALFVDGENFGILAIAAMEVVTRHIPHRLVYQGAHIARPHAYPGFELVSVEHIGKEAVDRAITIDATRAADRGARHIALVSNDRDYGATAVHLAQRCPGLRLSIIVDPSRVQVGYLKELKAHGIDVVDITGGEPVDEFSQKVMQAIRHLHHTGQLSLSRLGALLKERGVEYEAPLKQTLIRKNIATPDVKSPAESKDLIVCQTAGAKPMRLKTLG